MKFESVTLSSYNANHEYIICGSCKVINTQAGILQLVVLLDERIILHDEICSIEVNGLDFECLWVQLNENVIVANIKSIESQVYTKQLNR